MGACESPSSPKPRSSWNRAEVERFLGELDAPLARRLPAGAYGEVALRLDPVRLTRWDDRPRMAAS